MHRMGKCSRLTFLRALHRLKQNAGGFGLSYGGQLEFVNRVIKGVDHRALGVSERGAGSRLTTR